MHCMIIILNNNNWNWRAVQCPPTLFDSSSCSVSTYPLWLLQLFCVHLPSLTAPAVQWAPRRPACVSASSPAPEPRGYGPPPPWPASGRSPPAPAWPWRRPTQRTACQTPLTDLYNSTPQLMNPDSHHMLLEPNGKTPTQKVLLYNTRNDSISS